MVERARRVKPSNPNFDLRATDPILNHGRYRSTAGVCPPISRQNRHFCRERPRKTVDELRTALVAKSMGLRGFDPAVLVIRQVNAMLLLKSNTVVLNMTLSAQEPSRL